MGAIAGKRGTQFVPTMPQVSSYALTGNPVSGFVCFSLGKLVPLSRAPKPHSTAV